MAKSDFFFVGTPHDPRSISGSDPFTSHGSARLAVWYNCDKGNIDALQRSNLAASNNDRANKLRRWKDISGNSNRPTGTQRHLHVFDEFRPVLTGAYVPIGTRGGDITKNQMPIGGDNMRYLMGSQNQQGSFAWGIGNVPWQRDADDTNFSHMNSLDAPSNGWVTGSTSAPSAVSTLHRAEGQLSGGITNFTLMRPGTDSSDYEYTNFCGISYPFMWTKQTGDNNADGVGSGGAGFRINSGRNAGSNLTRFNMFWSKNQNVSENNWTWNHNYYGNYIRRIDTEYIYSVKQFHPVSCRYDALQHLGKTATVLKDDTDWLCQLHVNGYLANQKSGSLRGGNTVHTPMNLPAKYRGVKVGGAYHQADQYQGGGYQEYSNDSHTANMAGFGPAVSEIACYDDCLSDVRYQQIQRYFADRIQTTMSSSAGDTNYEYLSEFVGGPEGTSTARTSLSDPLSALQGGTYHREYKQANMPTTNYHETAAGVWAKSTVSQSAPNTSYNAGAFYEIPSTKAISMRAFVRCTGTNHAKHDGSQIALVAKATSQFGHKLDHIKGYAVKFGNFKDGANVSGAPKIRLSLRNSDQYLDGSTTDSCGDIDLTQGNVGSSGTLAVDKWYQIRMDVIPSGYSYDIIRVYARNDDDATWRQMGDASSNTEWKVYNNDPNYRYWADDTSPKRRVRSPI